MNETEIMTTASLGDTSHLLVSGDEAALVDPQRDSWGLMESCPAKGVRIRYVLETHVHNDYVSGALEVRAATGATVAGPARAPYAFDHLPLAEDDEITVGDLTVRAMETPGHTAEHTSYLVFDDLRERRRRPSSPGAASSSAASAAPTCPARTGAVPHAPATGAAARRGDAAIAADRLRERPWVSGRRHQHLGRSRPPAARLPHRGRVRAGRAHRAGKRVLDVRPERPEGGIPGTLAVPLAETPRGREIWTVCGSGRRAAIAASPLDRAGIPVTAVTRGGVQDLMAHA
ncbi:MBL fold metallo-hydrolase [Streptomyces sp. NBC_00122]|uniref:MBL fold metallo-hydrolase n=1 Tax=Streptomyces sp. NBC_00122 TaxID=2903623 RepID=UPI003252DD84